ncbi:Cytochrome b-c1 complex subunit 9 [Holothuria leucospilota]|uniref:Complex III subunit 9 n=1 Tax=Holothuria leucospilota TaxID=206669 RepID=A0A9Q1CDZ8_HOLLE|nr:Cytochrome b-c1 complex subunit 9 [Holothuria leucospilota]
MSFTQTIYNTVFRRTSSYALAIVVGAVFFERFFDQLGDGLFDYMNKGMQSHMQATCSKQWKDLKQDLALRQSSDEDE